MNTDLRLHTHGGRAHFVISFFSLCVSCFLFFCKRARSLDTNEGLADDSGPATGRYLTDWARTSSRRLTTEVGSLSFVIDHTWFHVFARSQTPRGSRPKLQLSLHFELVTSEWARACFVVLGSFRQVRIVSSESVKKLDVFYSKWLHGHVGAASRMLIAYTRSASSSANVRVR